ncbi:MAG TPA: zinc ribbon domain-containing protein [Bryobacteraceae bacterium]|jgi:putative FmdB family regulatory protein|nr:zinc ribbon domain-containing protein [Bryobacteraceae bacterium]
MPLYEYRCETCGNVYEQIRRISDADRDLECPDCKSANVKRLLSVFATSSAGGASSAEGCATCGAPRAFS